MNSEIVRLHQSEAHFMKVNEGGFVLGRNRKVFNNRLQCKFQNANQINSQLNAINPLHHSISHGGDKSAFGFVLGTVSLAGNGR